MITAPFITKGSDLYLGFGDHPLFTTQNRALATELAAGLYLPF